MSVLALTSGRHLPSSRLRVRQHIPRLRELGVRVDEFVPPIDRYARIPGWPEGTRQIYAGPLLAAWTAARLAAQLPGVFRTRSSQITWLEREMLPGLPSLEGLLKRPLVFDVDDAVWLTPPLGVAAARRIARRADVIVAGNRHLAEWFRNYNQNVRVIPTAIDTERFQPAGEKPLDSRTFVVGWIGTATNLPYLEGIERPLLRFFADHLDARLLVVAERPPALAPLLRSRTRFVPWSESAEVPAVQAMDVGLMPLPDNDWARGKCSFKMLQYMSCGLPVLVSPVGMNREVLSLGDVGLAAEEENDWYDCLLQLYRNREQAREYGRTGLQVARKHFACDRIAERLAGLFQELAGGEANRALGRQG